MIRAVTPKDPDDIDDFTFDWVTRLVGAETLASFTPTVVAGDCEVGSATIDGTNTIVRLINGSPGTTVQVRFRITTSSGRRLDRTLQLKVKEQ